MGSYPFLGTGPSSDGTRMHYHAVSRDAAGSPWTCAGARGASSMAMRSAGTTTRTAGTTMRIDETLAQAMGSG